MGQVTIYLEDDIEAKMQVAAKAMNLSHSKFIAKLIEANVLAEAKGLDEVNGLGEADILEDWPDSVKNLAGAWPDFPTLEEIRSMQVDDVSREVL